MPKNCCFWTTVQRRLLKVPWTARRSNHSVLKKINAEYSLKDWCWSSNNLATWCKESSHWKRSWYWERLKAEEEGNRQWDGWKASLIQWTWTWANSKRWWGTGKTGVLQNVGLRRVRYNLATEQQHQICLKATVPNSTVLSPFSIIKT